MKGRKQTTALKSARMTVNMTPETYELLRSEADKVSLPLGQFIVSEAARSVQARKREEIQRETVQTQAAIMNSQTNSNAQMGDMLQAVAKMLPQMMKLQGMEQGKSVPEGQAGKPEGKTAPKRAKAPQKGKKRV